MSDQENLLAKLKGSRNRLHKAIERLGVPAKVFLDGCIVVDSEAFLKESYMTALERDFRILAEAIEKGSGDVNI